MFCAFFERIRRRTTGRFPWYIGIILFLLLLLKRVSLLFGKGDLKGSGLFGILISDTDIVGACL